MQIETTKRKNYKPQEVEVEDCSMCKSKLLKLERIGGGTARICQNKKCSMFINYKAIKEKWKRQQVNVKAESPKSVIDRLHAGEEI